MDLATTVRMKRKVHESKSLTGGTLPPDKSLHRSARPALKLLALIVSLALAMGLAEITLRLFFRNRLAYVRDERSLLYHYDKTLGWFPRPNSTNSIFSSRKITAIHNSEGFRDSEHVPSDKPVIVFLGDSFLWGYDVEASERFTDKLQAKHPEWSVYNLGVSGYGTDQEYLLLQRHFDEYKPRVVFLLFCTDNDGDDNSTNVRYGGYYKPYYTFEGHRLHLHGVPVPRSEATFLKEHHRLARSYLVRLLARAYYKMVGPRRYRSPIPPAPSCARCSCT
jgi:hypothetical protein